MTERAVLAYVFWHWRRRDVAAAAYEGAQRAFHAALAGSSPAGYTGSFSVALDEVPWIPGGDDAYEDWYLLEDFTALGALNEAAVSHGRAAPHDAAAALAAGGSGGLYRLRLGRALREPRRALWFGKPDGMRYGELFALVAPVVEEVGGVLWVRQLTLGPAREFCLHAPAAASLPAPFKPLAVSLRAVWPAPVGRP